LRFILAAPESRRFGPSSGLINSLTVGGVLHAQMIEPSALLAFEVPSTYELTIVLSANIKQFGSFLFAR
jgi:hypothetical protein